MSTYYFKGSKRTWTPREEEEQSHLPLQKRDAISLNETVNANANIDNEHEKWSTDMIILLLRLYGSHKCLWDTHDKDNNNRKLRNAALLDITAAMGEKFSKQQIVQKINVLRATYRYEKRRIKQRMRKGIGAKTKLKWFALADSFLRDVPRLGRLRKKKGQVVDSDSDLEHEMVLTIDPEAVIPFNEEEESESGILRENGNDRLNNKKDVIKTRWTSDQSLKFVKLLENEPILWQENLHNELIEREAIKSLALKMEMTYERIKKRVQIFKDTCCKENGKLCSNPNYQPNYIWWPLAVSFMPQEENRIDFVDTNAIIPTTPQQVCSVSSPLMSEMFVESPSVGKKLDSEDEMNEFKTEIAVNETIGADALTKLVWNELEDDLLEGKWSLKHSVKFLRLYGAHHCLWDLNDPNYRSRELRAAAIEDIAAEMGHGLNADYVAKKIKIFRITYMQHRKRMLTDIMAGKEPEIQLRWFPLADSFLRPHIGLRSIQEKDREIPQFDYQYVMANLNLIDPDLLSDFRGKFA